MGAEEVFPDALALLRWRDRNQRMLPKLALDGEATRDSAEQLIHCLASGEQDSQCVVYGHGVSQPIEISPTLLSAWSGTLLGFRLNRWVHELSQNAAKTMSVMENITKLVRANKFTLDTVLYKVGEDAITDAFNRSADASDSSQVVLIFPTLQEEMQNNGRGGGGKAVVSEAGQSGAERAQSSQAKEDEERERLKTEWLNQLFTDRSVASESPEGPLPTTFEGGDTTAPKSLLVWLGDDTAGETSLLQDFADQLGGTTSLLCLSWKAFPAGENFTGLDLSAPEVVNGSWYSKERAAFDNEDLDQLHDIELIGRGISESIEIRLAKLDLTWKNVVLSGFGMGAGFVMWASMTKLIPEKVAGGIFFNAVVPFPNFLAEKAAKRHATPAKMFTIWGSRDRSTPATYRQLIQSTMRKFPEVACTEDTLPDVDHNFGEQSLSVMSSLVPVVLPR
jgi:predicted esterase